MFIGLDAVAIGDQSGTLQSVGESHEIDRGALLGVGTAAGSPPGGLFAVGMLNFDELTEFLVAGVIGPSVRGWRLRISPGFSPVPHFAFSSFVNQNGKNLAAGCQIVKQAVVIGDRFYIEVSLVDGTNTEIDPANVLGITSGALGPNLVSIGIVQGGILSRP